MNPATAEHGRYARRAQSLREREEVLIQIPATTHQRQLVTKPDVELHRQQAVYCREHRRRLGFGMVKELAQPDLAGLPAMSQLASCGSTRKAARCVGRQYNVVMP